MRPGPYRGRILAVVYACAKSERIAVSDESNPANHNVRGFRFAVRIADEGDAILINRQMEELAG